MTRRRWGQGRLDKIFCLVNTSTRSYLPCQHTFHEIFSMKASSPNRGGIRKRRRTSERGWLFDRPSQPILLNLRRAAMLLSISSKVLRQCPDVSNFVSDFIKIVLLLLASRDRLLGAYKEE